MSDERLNPKWLIENGFEITYDNQPHHSEFEKVTGNGRTLHVLCMSDGTTVVTVGNGPWLKESPTCKEMQFLVDFLKN